jgi:galactonate dehydratase
VKITRLEPILFDAGLGHVWCFVRVETDAGITGYGEGSTTEPYMVAAVVRRLAAWLVGEDARRIQDLWQRMYRRHHNVRGGNLMLCAISGIEHALWDIKGKAVGLPVYELLGGVVRDRIPAYVNHMFFPPAAAEDAAARFAARAAEAVARGYRAVKITPFGQIAQSIDPSSLRRVCRIVAAVRDSVGPDVEIGIDCHGRFAMAAAIRVGNALAEYNPFFLEEPVPPENVTAMRKVRESVPVTIATGERIYTKWGYRDLLEQQAAEVLQVDVAHCGGILEARLIAGMAEAYYTQLAPHSWYGPVSLAASLHLDACTPNILIQEHPVPYELPPQRRDLLATPFALEDGHLVVPTGPGLGVTLDEQVLARFTLQD